MTGPLITTCDGCQEVHVARDGVTLDCDGLRWRGWPIRLGAVARAIMRRLMIGPGIVSTHELVDWVYGADPNGGPDEASRSLYVHIVKLRKKIYAPGWPNMIGTNAAHGYEFLPPIQKEAAA